MIYARQHPDITEAGQITPLQFHKPYDSWDVTVWYPCLQPDELDNAEYNLILLQNDLSGVFDIGMSSDFEFKDVK